MDEMTLSPKAALPRWRAITTDGLTIETRDGLAMATISARKGTADAVGDAVRAAYGFDLPAARSFAAADGIMILWSGPQRWLAVADRGFGRDIEAELLSVLAGSASVTDQSDGRCVVRVAGRHARALLAKGVPIDLHPRVFATGSVATTHANHIGIMIWQVDDAPTFDIATARSSAESFADWLRVSAAEFLRP